METTIIVNSLSELIAVAKFWGVDVETSSIVISFPYRFKYDHEITVGVNEEMCYEEFERKYLIF